MTKIGRLNVDLTANTRGFDVAMRNARTQLRDLRRAAAPGLGAMGAGGLGQMMGVMSMSGPLAAIGAATMAVSHFAAQMAADRARGASNLSEILVARTGVQDQARLSALSRAVTGEDSAVPAREAMRAVQSMDWRTMSAAIGAGVERSTLESLKRIADPAEFFRQLHAAQDASPGLAQAVGGKAGEFIARMAVLNPERFDEMASMGHRRTSAQVLMAAQQANRELTDERSWLENWPRIQKGLEVLQGIGRSTLGTDVERNAVVSGDSSVTARLQTTLESIDRKIAGAAQ